MLLASLRLPSSCTPCLRMETSAPLVEDELHLVLCENWQVVRDRFLAVFEWAGYTDLLDIVRREGDIDSGFWTFLHTMFEQQVSMFTGYLA